MCIWTSKRGGSALAFVCLFLLTACAGGVGVPGLSGGKRQVALGGGDVVIAGPRGYCVDEGATRDAATGGFAMLASCAALTLSPLAPRPDVRAVLTASVSAVDTTGAGFDTAAAESFFRSDGGRAMLARSGDAATLTVVASRRSETSLLLALVDTSQGLAPGMDDAYWRALTELRGRIVTLSVLPPEGAAITPEAGFALTAQFVAQVRALNP